MKKYVSRLLIGMGVAAFGIVLTVFAAVPVMANPHPLLQLYAEGATYNPLTESWELDISPGESANVWTVGNLLGPGGAIPLKDIQLIVFVDAIPAANTFSYGTMGGGGTFVVDGTFNFEDLNVLTGTIPFTDHLVADGLPVLSDGNSLPPHGVHMSGFTHWLELDLGTYNLPDSEILDFIAPLDPDSYKTCTTPGDPTTCPAQIDVITVAAGLGFTRMHFDLIGTNGTQGIFSPFSHDLTDTSNGPNGGPPRIPEPGTMLVFAFGLLSMAFIRRRVNCTT